MSKLGTILYLIGLRRASTAVNRKVAYKMLTNADNPRTLRFVYSKNGTVVQIGCTTIPVMGEAEIRIAADNVVGLTADFRHLVTLHGCVPVQWHTNVKSSATNLGTTIITVDSGTFVFDTFLPVLASVAQV